MNDSANTTIEDRFQQLLGDLDTLYPSLAGAAESDIRAIFSAGLAAMAELIIKQRDLSGAYDKGSLE